MSDIAAEKRLELIRCIREENERNRMRIRAREHILYGKKSEEFEGTLNENRFSYEQNRYGEELESKEKKYKIPLSGLWIRTLLATVLFAAYIILDFSGAKALGADAAYIYDRISENYTPNVIDFIDKITYTLSNVFEETDSF